MTEHWPYRNGPGGYPIRNSTPTPAYRADDAPTEVGALPPISPAQIAAAQRGAPEQEERDYPTTFERVLAAVAYTMVIVTCLVTLYAYWRVYVFVDNLSDAFRETADYWRRLAGEGGGAIATAALVGWRWPWAISRHSCEWCGRTACVRMTRSDGIYRKTLYTCGDRDHMLAADGQLQRWGAR